jgi:hypothetical protein
MFESLNQKVQLSTKKLQAIGGILIALGMSTNAMAGDVTLRSAGALSFGPGDVLFVGDNLAGKVHAFDFPSEAFDNQEGYALGRAQSFEGRTIIDNIDGQIAAILGTTADEVVINDMVVHPVSKQIFVSVHRGKGPKPSPIILKVNKGILTPVDLSAAEHSFIALNVASEKAFEFGQSLNTLAITDIDYFNGELFIAGLSNEEFSSKLRRVAFPFKGKVSESSIEIWHAVHAQFETRAPIITQDIRVIDDVPTLIAVYACTPLVKIPLSDLQDGKKVRGTMIGEMGFGNTPIDIVSFTHPMYQQDVVLVTNTNRSAVQVTLSDIGKAEAMPFGEGVQPVFSTAGVPQYELPMSGTLHLALMDEQWAVTVRRDPEDVSNLQLHTLPIPFFFDRADHIVEMNFDDGPDPFGYKKLPPVDYK